MKLMEYLEGNTDTFHLNLNYGIVLNNLSSP